MLIQRQPATNETILELKHSLELVKVLIGITVSDNPLP